ncbi:MAG: hypothetical protein WC390_09090 [Sulfurimonas sp.]|jgi:hypothetical protein
MIFNPGYSVPAINQCREILARSNSSHCSVGNSPKPARKQNVCVCLSSGKAIRDEFYECDLCESTGIYPPILKKKRPSIFKKIIAYFK